MGWGEGIALQNPGPRLLMFRKLMHGLVGPQGISLHHHSVEAETHGILHRALTESKPFLEEFKLFVFQVVLGS